MILVIDSGNSRMKWGLHGPRGWLGQGVVSNAELATLALRDWQLPVGLSWVACLSR